MERPTFEKAMQDIINALPMDFYDDVEKIQSYIEMLEAENKTLAHKAGQYDSVVATIKVSDSGRFRNDTIEALLKRIEKVSNLEAENVALRDENQKLRGWSEALENIIRAAKDEYDKDPD